MVFSGNANPALADAIARHIGVPLGYASISKSKTVIKPSSDKNYVRAKLIRNLESAFIKLRRHHLKTQEIHVILRRQDFTHFGLRARLNRPTFSTQEALGPVTRMFEELFRANTLYRCTSIVLSKIGTDDSIQYELFEDSLKIEKLCKLSQAVDNINNRCGKHKVSLASSLFLQSESNLERGEPAWRKVNLLPGETPRRRINLPRMDVKV